MTILTCIAGIMFTMHVSMLTFTIYQLMLSEYNFFLCFSLTACLDPDIPHGFAVVPNNDTLYYTCEEGYKLSSKGWWAKAKCNDGLWSGLEQCIGNSSLMLYRSSCNQHEANQIINLKLYINISRKLNRVLESVTIS